METVSSLNRARELSPDQRRAIESLLGHILDDDDIVTVQSSRGHLVKAGLTGEARAEAFRALFDRINRTAERVKGVPEEEIDAAIDEACEYVRHHPE